MFRLIISRVVGFVTAIAVASVIVFLLLGVAPGHHAGAGASPASASGPAPDLAPWQDMANSFSGLITGDFGVSSLLGAPVAGATAAASLFTLTLALLALVIALLVGLPLGLLMATRHGAPLGAALSLVTRLGVAAPNFWLGMLLVLASSALLRWLPGGWTASPASNPQTALPALILPAVALALPPAAILARIMSQTLLELRGSDFIRTARAKGMTTREAVRRHGLHYLLLPVIGTLGAQLGLLITGAVIVENVFVLPGLGRLILGALIDRDLVLLQAALLVLIVAMGLALLVASLIGIVADPRLRARGR